MKMRRGVLIALLGLASCGEAPKEAAKTPALPDLPKPIADDVRFPSPKRTSIQVVESKLLGLDFLGGGNLAEYADGKKRYKLFTIRCRTPQQAGAYIFDIKSQMNEPKFVASYGGYFSESSAGPLFVFARGNYIGGIVGLSEEDAIQAGKDFAARL